MLEKKRNYVVLDNVHYLEKETLKDLAIAIRAFSDKGIKFVMIGVKKEPEKFDFFQINPDLKGRLEYIEVKAMSREILLKLLRKLLSAVNIQAEYVCQTVIINRVEKEPYKVIKAVQVICNEFSIKQKPKKPVSLYNPRKLKQILDSY